LEKAPKKRNWDCGNDYCGNPVLQQLLLQHQLLQQLLLQQLLLQQQLLRYCTAVLDIALLGEPSGPCPRRPT
jgi:hypothetical protein